MHVVDQADADNAEHVAEGEDEHVAGADAALQGRAGEFTSEKFKIRVDNVPRVMGPGTVKQLLRKLKLVCDVM